MKKLTNIEFLERCYNKHGDKYEYISKYINNKTYIEIKCKKHNIVFKQTPNLHLNGSGCPLCGNNNKGRKLSNEEFLIKANKIHNNKYNYISEYTKSKNKMIIECKEHGIFTQISNDHLNGHGCPECGGTKSSSEKYFNNCEKIHKNKFEYDYSSFKNYKNNIRVKCKEHGWFLQNASSHLNGNGCSKCSKKYRYKDMDDFVKKARSIHGYKYEYFGDYINGKNYIDIICKEHGKFKMRASNHINGKNGCPGCKTKKARLRRIKEISFNKFNGYQVIPSFNINGCEILDNISNEKGIKIKHAMNGGEFYIKELGYWVDGYDKENNIVYEIDENFHFDKNGNLKEKDIKRQKEIEKFLKCKFIRIKMKQKTIK